VYSVAVLPNEQDYRLVDGDPASRYSDAATTRCAPRAVAIVNGIAVELSAFEVECNTHGASDSGSLTMGVAGNPDWSEELKSALGDGSVIVEIYVGFPPETDPTNSISGLKRVFLGLLQVMNPVFHEDQATFRLQSLAAMLTAEKVTTQFGQSEGNGGIPGTAGYTTVQFVQYAADLFGLTTKIDVPGTPALMTQVYAARQWVGVKNLRIWDVLLACAETDNADVFVDPQGVLNYVQPTSIGRGVRPMAWGADIQTASGEHAPQFSKTIKVQVTSWTRKTRTATSSTLRVNPSGSVSLRSSSRVVTTDRIAGSTAAISTSQTYNSDGSYSSTTGESVTTGGAANSGYTSFQADSGVETYKFSIKNLTPAQCNAKAVQLWNQISRFEYTLSLGFAVTPGLIGGDGKGSVLDIATLYQVSNLPWSAFNNSAAAGLLAGAKPSAGSPGPLQQSFATGQDRRYYYQRRYVLRFGISQEEGGESEGLTMTVDLVNHPLPQSGVNSTGGAF